MNIPNPIPVFVIVYNLFSTTRRLTEDLLRMGGRVFLVDNSSSYPPLLDWYETIHKNPDVHIVKLGENLGPHVIYNRLSFFKEKYHEITGHQLPDEFIITDCDLDISAVPDDGLKILYQLREEDRKSERPHLKIGFGLRLDDLPNDPLLRS